MEKIKHAHGFCPHCGKAVGGAAQARYEGSPLRTCKKCGGTYLDDRYSEVALYGEPENVHSVMPWLKGAGILLVLGLAAAGFNVALLYFENSYYPMLWVLVVCSGIGILYELWQVIGVKTGRVARAYEKKRQASVARLQDPDYARLLAENDYPVPGEYLKNE